MTERPDPADIPTKVMRQLYDDHVKVGRLLRILEDQLLIVERAGEPDCVLMADIMHYMTSFPDLFHHPMEDRVFERLVEREPSAGEPARTLLKEHASLALKGQRLLGSVRGLASEAAMVPRADFVAQGRDYVEFLKRHIEREERQLFPLACRILTGEDDAAIERALAVPSDPLFGEIVADEYRNLYRHIQQTIE